MSSEKKEKKQHKMNFNIKEKLKKAFSKEHLKEVFTGEEQKKHLKLKNEDGVETEQTIISHRKLTGCIGDVIYLKSLNNEYKLDIK